MKMCDHNVFAILTASDQKNFASTAFKLADNSQWFRKAKTNPDIAERPTIDRREATPAGITEFEQSEEAKAKDDISAVDSLFVTFDQLFLSENLLQGVQFGTDPESSHVLLGYRGTKGISASHFNISVDNNLWIWLHDYSSSNGTAVAHNGQNQNEVRKRETWILAYEPGSASSFEKTTIHAARLGLKIQFPNHAAANPQYVKNLRLLTERRQEVIAETLAEEFPHVQGLGLNSVPTTQAASEAPTVGERLIYYRTESIGKGFFGDVHKAIRARDGKLFAAKTFRDLPNKRKRNEVMPASLWRIRREFTLMKDNPHPNVTQVFELRETPEPMIIMDYYSHGNIKDAGIVDEARCITGFGQLLDALSHLHEKGVVHRDLKPENFLVELKPYFKLVLTDFGVANVANTPLHTFCGTFKYAAPEVFPGHSEGHGPLADIWSMGVVCMEWVYGIPMLPKPPQRTEQCAKWHERWAEKLRRTLEEADDAGTDRLIDILSHMIEVNPSDRWSAKKCLKEGLDNGLFERRHGDGLFVCAHDQDDLTPTADKGDGETKTALTSV